MDAFLNSGNAQWKRSQFAVDHCEDNAINEQKALVESLYVSRGVF